MYQLCFNRYNIHLINVLNILNIGKPEWLSGLAPPSAQGMVLETRDQVPHRLPAWSLLLPLPVSLPLSLSISRE